MPSFLYGLLIIFGFRLFLYGYRRGWFDRKEKKDNAVEEREADPLAADRPIAFGHKSVWLAIRSGEPERVAQVLGLKEVEPSSWRAGLYSAYADKTFVTPPVDDWCMVVSGADLFDADSQLKEIKELLVRCSLVFGRAMYFASYLSVGLESWILAEEGKLLRVFVMVDGQILEDEGEALEGDAGTAEEVAGLWSVNPAKLGERTQLGRGLLGRLH